MSKGKLIAGGIAAYVAAAYIGYQYSQISKTKEQVSLDGSFDPKNIILKENERLASFNKHAKTYDIEIGWDEFFMGVNLLRWWHLHDAKGDVLEVGCGTGRNFDYYGRAKSITAVDAVEGMVQQALLKTKNRKNLRVQQMNAHQLTFPDKSFDTVVDTFGLCSYDDPIAVLSEMKRVCRPNGRILLIEHGRGSYDWINGVLDGGACHHAHNWGCIWNRDILAILQKSNLKVVSVSRFHFGTTYLIEAVPDTE